MDLAVGLGEGRAAGLRIAQNAIAQDRHPWPAAELGGRIATDRSRWALPLLGRLVALVAVDPPARVARRREVAAKHLPVGQFGLFQVNRFHQLLGWQRLDKPGPHPVLQASADRVGGIRLGDFRGRPEPVRKWLDVVPGQHLDRPLGGAVSLQPQGLGFNGEQLGLGLLDGRRGAINRVGVLRQEILEQTPLPTDIPRALNLVEQGPPVAAELGVFSPGTQVRKLGRLEHAGELGENFVVDLDRPLVLLAIGRRAGVDHQTLGALDVPQPANSVLNLSLAALERPDQS